METAATAAAGMATLRRARLVVPAVLRAAAGARARAACAAAAKTAAASAAAAAVVEARMRDVVDAQITAPAPQQNHTFHGHGRRGRRRVTQKEVLQ